MLHHYNAKSVWYMDRSRMQDNIFLNRFITLYFRKRSEVETWDGGLVYRRRIFRWFGLMPCCYVNYFFHSISDIEDDVNQCYWISGKISAVYVLEDGQTVHHTEMVRHVSFPKFFSNMEVILKELSALRKP